MLFSHQHVANNNIAHLRWNKNVLILLKMSMPCFCIISKLYFSSVFHASKSCFIFPSIYSRTSRHYLPRLSMNPLPSVITYYLSVCHVQKLMLLLGKSMFISVKIQRNSNAENLTFRTPSYQVNRNWFTLTNFVKYCSK